MPPPRCSAPVKLGQERQKQNVVLKRENRKDEVRQSKKTDKQSKENNRAYKQIQNIQQLPLNETNARSKQNETDGGIDRVRKKSTEFLKQKTICC